MKQARQGDVMVERVRAGKWAAINGDRVILAYGEATGHCHEVLADDPMLETDVPAAQLFEAPDGTRYLLVVRACQLVHQEHGAIPLASGTYQVTRQRQYSPQAIRPVED